MSEMSTAPEGIDAPKKSRPVWLVVLVVLIVVCCCCAALAALTGALWNFGDQLLGVTNLPAIGLLA